MTVCDLKVLAELAFYDTPNGQCSSPGEHAAHLRLLKKGLVEYNPTQAPEYVRITEEGRIKAEELVMALEGSVR